MQHYDGSRLTTRTQDRVGRFLMVMAIAIGLFGVGYGLGYEIATQNCEVLK